MGGSQAWLRASLRVFIVLAALAALAYVPALTLPFISDDYIQISLARDYGPVSGWQALASDALYRCRATSLVMTYWTERLFGLRPLAFNWSSLLLHIFNVWLVFALGAWRRIGWRISAVAAGFFAIYEGHQEAVIWYAALPELLVFFFSLAALVCWILWLESGERRRWYYAASLVLFLLALASKESAVAVVGLLLLSVFIERERWRQRLLQIVPFAVAGLVYAWLIYAAPPSYLHLHDGTFSIRAPFWITLIKSTGRLFWFWGLLGVLALAVLRKGERRDLLAVALGWDPHHFPSLLLLDLHAARAEPAYVLRQRGPGAGRGRGIPGSSGAFPSEPSMGRPRAGRRDDRAQLRLPMDPEASAIPGKSGAHGAAHQIRAPG